MKTQKVWYWIYPGNKLLSPMLLKNAPPNKSIYLDENAALVNKPHPSSCGTLASIELPLESGDWALFGEPVPAEKVREVGEKLLEAQTLAVARAEKELEIAKANAQAAEVRAEKYETAYGAAQQQIEQIETDRAVVFLENTKLRLEVEKLKRKLGQK